MAETMMTNHNTTSALLVSTLRTLYRDVKLRTLPALLDEYLRLRDLGHSRLASFRIAGWMVNQEEAK